jgi:ferredoxin--NADP+ reductase
MALNEGDALRVAIIGSGPSGFFAVEALLKAGIPVVVHLFDRLPTPFGLVRGGVAPDHPKIKLVTRAWEKTATNPAFAFWGNVEVGRDLRLDELRRFYDAVLFTSGAASDRRMNIPGEDLQGSHAATEFVGWYNGHPDYAARAFDLDAPAAVVIGQGNVAMDVARMLAKTADELKGTDVASHALTAFVNSQVRDIYIVGRRGPAQAKFTPPELRELGELPDADVVVNAKDLLLSSADESEVVQEQYIAKNMALLRQMSTRPSQGKPRRVHLCFKLSPVRIESTDGRVASMVLERTRLVGEAGAQQAVGTQETIEIPCGLVFRSVGYQGTPIDGVPFDAKSGTIPNVSGRVTSDGKIVPGLYTAGWIKRGPSGVVGTNKPDAVESVEKLLEDKDALARAPERSSAGLLALLASRNVLPVSFAAWQKIDAIERANGKALGKPREKLARWEELLRAAR